MTRKGWVVAYLMNNIINENENQGQNLEEGQEERNNQN